MTRIALLSLLLLVSAACGGNRASGGADASATLRPSGPILVVENKTGYDYEIFASTIGAIYGGRPIGTVRALQNSSLPLVDVPGNRYVWFHARPMGTAGEGVSSGRMEFGDQRQLTWNLSPDRAGRVHSILSGSAAVPPPSGAESERDPTGEGQ